MKLFLRILFIVLSVFICYKLVSLNKVHKDSLNNEITPVGERQHFIRSILLDKCSVFEGSQIPVRRRFRPRHVSGRAILNRRKLASRIIVSEKLKLVYCPIPKAASSTWKYFIRQQEGIPNYWNLSSANSPVTSGLKYLIDYSSEEIERILASPEYLKVTFVRNPYSRLLSCYLDKFQYKTKDSEEYRKFMGHLFGWWDMNIFENISLSSEERSLLKKQKLQKKILKGPRPSFSQFIRTVIGQKLAKMNEHWAPQWYICGLDLIPFDVVGRFEQVEQDAKIVFAWIGNFSTRLPSPQEIGFPATEGKVVEDSYFNMNLMFLIRKAFAPDFKIFGYDNAKDGFFWSEKSFNKE
eukprot:jgi/Galph1/2145/GphlegSOOS_G771.1